MLARFAPAFFVSIFGQVGNTTGSWLLCHPTLSHLWKHWVLGTRPEPKKCRACLPVFFFFFLQMPPISSYINVPHIEDRSSHFWIPASWKGDHVRCSCSFSFDGRNFRILYSIWNSIYEMTWIYIHLYMWLCHVKVPMFEGWESSLWPGYFVVEPPVLLCFMVGSRPLRNSRCQGRRKWGSQHLSCGAQELRLCRDRGGAPISHKHWMVLSQEFVLQKYSFYESFNLNCRNL